MLTPDEISVPSVRVNRDTADLRTTSPRTGALSIRPSTVFWPPVVA